MPPMFLRSHKALATGGSIWPQPSSSRPSCWLRWTQQRRNSGHVTVVWTPHAWLIWSLAPGLTLEDLGAGSLLGGGPRGHRQGGKTVSWEENQDSWARVLAGEGRPEATPSTGQVHSSVYHGTACCGM